MRKKRTPWWQRDGWPAVAVITIGALAVAMMFFWSRPGTTVPAFVADTAARRAVRAWLDENLGDPDYEITYWYPAVRSADCYAEQLASLEDEFQEAALALADAQRVVADVADESDYLAQVEQPTIQPLGNGAYAYHTHDGSFEVAIERFPSADAARQAYRKRTAAESREDDLYSANRELSSARSEHDWRKQRLTEKKEQFESARKFRAVFIAAKVRSIGPFGTPRVAAMAFAVERGKVRQANYQEVFSYADRCPDSEDAGQLRALASRLRAGYRENTWP